MLNTVSKHSVINNKFVLNREVAKLSDPETYNTAGRNIIVDIKVLVNFQIESLTEGFVTQNFYILLNNIKL